MNKTQRSDRPVAVELLVLGILVSLGVALRLQFSHIPNFAPVAAMALFAGFYFRSVWLALCLPVLVMAITDWQLGGYDWKLRIVVYAMLACPVAFRVWTRRFDPAAGKHRPAVCFASLFAASLAGSVIFFVGTNFACWAFSSWYTKDLAGLSACFTAAIPFFRYTLIGDASFAFVLFSSYALLTAPAAQRLVARR